MRGVEDVSDDQGTGEGVCAACVPGGVQRALGAGDELGGVPGDGAVALYVGGFSPLGDDRLSRGGVTQKQVSHQGATLKAKNTKERRRTE